jgi:polyketide cyclase/dehydrase/lipid transport protein
VFEFLSDLSNHWRLVDRFVEVISLTGADGGPPDSGVVRLRGPLGVRRTVHTRVTATRSPRLIIGTAELGPGTRARVSWTLASRLGQTEVRLAAQVERAGPLDRLLLKLGGRRWLRQRFAFGLERLASTMIEPRRQPASGTARPTASPPGPAYQSEGGSS